MLSRAGRVLWIRDGLVGVCLSDNPACVGCAGACGLLSFGRAFRHRSRACELPLPADTDLQPGDSVLVEARAESFLGAAFTSLGVPLLGLLAGGFAGATLLQGDFATLVGGLGGLLVGTLASSGIRRHSRPLALTLRANP